MFAVKWIIKIEWSDSVIQCVNKYLVWGKNNMDKHNPFGSPNLNNTENTDGYANSTVSIMTLFYRVLDKAIYIIVIAIICALLLGAYADSKTVTVYSSTSKLYLINTTDVTLTTSDLQVANYLVNDYLAVFTTNELHQLVAEELNYKYSINELNSMISVGNDMDTHIIDITITYRTPDDVQLIADIYAELSRSVIERKLNVPEPGLFEHASAPVPILISNSTSYRIIGAMAGFFISFIVVVIYAIFDERIRTPHELEQHFGLQTLGFLTDNSKSKQFHLFGKGRR